MRQNPITKWLCGSILAVSLLGVLLQRKTGVGLSQLDFQVQALWQLELWRLVTYPFVLSSPLGLIMHLVILWLFGQWFEARYTSKGFLRFFALASVGAALLAVPLSTLINLTMPFYDLGQAEGPGPAIDAMLVALALLAPESRVLLGFVVPMRARTIVLALLALQVIEGIYRGASGLSITLGGMLMGYFLVTGNWRPRRLLGQWQIWRNRRRRGLYVVPPPPPPPPPDAQTLH